MLGAGWFYIAPNIIPGINGEGDFCTLSISINPLGGGSVSPPSSNRHEQGTQVTLTATPATCYRFTHWSGDASGASSTLTITMDSDKSVVANFSKVPYSLTTSVSPSGSGSITPSSGSYDCGESVTLTATPASCYRFDYWEGDALGASSTITITMNSNKNVVANFTTIRYSLSTSVSPSGSGSIAPSSGSYDCGESVTLTATPASSRYVFDHWAGDVLGSSSTVTVTMTSNKNIIANFRDICPQRIEFKIPGVGFIGPSPRWVEYSKWLQQGEEVTCSVQLKGGSLAYGWDWTWWVKVYDPANNVYRSWDKKLEQKLPSVIEFDFRASYEGEYKIRIIHKEFYDKEGIMTIWPPSWRQTEY